MYSSRPQCFGKSSRAIMPAGAQYKRLLPRGIFRMQAKRLARVGEEIAARDFALDQHGLARRLPSDNVGNFAGGAILLGEDDAASIAVAQPVGGAGD